MKVTNSRRERMLIRACLSHELRRRNFEAPSSMRLAAGNSHRFLTGREAVNGRPASDGVARFGARYCVSPGVRSLITAIPTAFTGD
ncbi:MAG: hypothetical protein WA418_19715 [Bradyrhizobium sp.]